MPLFFDIHNPITEEGLFCAYYYEKRDLDKALTICGDYFKKTKNPLTAGDLATIAYLNENQRLLEQLKDFALKINHPVRNYILALYYHLKESPEYINYLKRYLENNQPSREKLIVLLKPLYQTEDPTLYWLYMYRFYKIDPSEEKIKLLTEFIFSLDGEKEKEITDLGEKLLKKEGGNKFLYTTLVLGLVQLFKENKNPEFLRKVLPIIVQALRCCPDNKTFLITAYINLYTAQLLGLKLPEEDFYPYNLLKELSKPYPPLGKVDQYLEEVKKLPAGIRWFIYSDFLYKETKLPNLPIAERILKQALKEDFPLNSPLWVKVVPYLLEKFLTEPSTVDREVLKQIEKLHPEASETVLIKALIETKKGNTEGAKRLLEQINESDLARDFDEVNNFYTALRVYLFGDDIKELPPPKAGFVLRIIYELNPQKAKALAKEYFKNCPKPAAFMQVLSGFNPKCLELPELISKIGINCYPDNPWLLNFLGYTYLLEDKNLDKAQKLLEKAYKLNPDSPDILDSLGWAYFLKGNLQKAKLYIEEALQKKPDEPVILYHYGEILLKENRPCKAKEVLEKSLKRLSELPAEPEMGILKRVEKTLKEAKERCSD